MSLIDLTSQSRFRISQDLGSQAQGCRLDARGLMEIGALLHQTLDGNVELLVLNRFGKAESGDGGLRSDFARAIESGSPAVTAADFNYILLHRSMAGIPWQSCDKSPTGIGCCLRVVSQSGAKVAGGRRNELSSTG